ncbi:16S rRNA (cytosine(967)-C(5))-methyltransferase RsmB [Facilibium subflavum]|uniref:16S rRNA (cytosine(967)-C(5))-methyltransferase RsmB n=1 Tax=Facilibium subflavum TaxID=2219058 RepID=UPI000E65CF70|nr:16S rRNA (cytosine(967)-C(5))-methyltransferase RsmB [Facilibium subflavum]
MKNSRAIACEIIHKITQHQISLISIDQLLSHENISDQDRRFIYAICYGVFRHYFYLEQHLLQICKQKTKAKVKSLLLTALYQLIFMHQPKHAIINETVNACKALKLNAVCGFVNVALKNFKSHLPPYDPAKDMPDWLIGKLQKHYDNADDIVIQSNSQPPVFIRLNQQKNQTELLKRFQKNNIAFDTTVLPYCLKLNKNYNIAQLPGFNEGLFSVQDLSAQYAAHILAPKPNEHILDACAAPGGKTAHLLEKCTEISLTIADCNEKRFAKIHENLTRLKLDDKLKLAFLRCDITQKQFHKQFDKILLDAPCSATGVIRRHPDIKVLRTPEEIKTIVEIQRKLLANLWPQLKPGGMLLYVTCSILPEENDKQISQFLLTHTNVTVLDISIFNHESRKKYGYQLLPKTDQGDGFYYCLLRKEA